MEPRGAEYLSIKAMAASQRRRSPRSHLLRQFGVPQRNAVFVAARGIDNLPGRDGTVGVNPVARSPTEGGGQVGDLLATSIYRCRREFSHANQGRRFPSGDCIKSLGPLISGENQICAGPLR